MLLVSVVAVGLAAAGCGESDEDKAKGEVCDARDDIQTNVEELQDLTIGTATLDQVRSNLEAIGDDLQTIADAQGQLSDADRQQVEQANQTFKSSVQRVAGDLGQSLSLEDAGQQLKSAFADLGKAYREAFEPIDCD